MQHLSRRLRWLLAMAIIIASGCWTHSIAQKPLKDNRLNWWRDARFGMFIHWGLYAIPAGEWNGQTNYGEWIRNNARIPLTTYDHFLQQFNPTDFNAASWVSMAKQAGMKYIVITTKHHDGFCLFDSKYTDFDVMNTPYGKDIIKELASACEKENMPLCFYYSIMDWHHPDYLPRRDWEYDRPTTDADFDRYVEYMKNQLKELLTNYGKIGVLWFDGEWEESWTHERGKDLYQYVRSLQPGILINNRVDKGRPGMAGLTIEGDYVGDFGTPEQEIPATGIPNMDWESCMTMNENWGYNSHDSAWKSAPMLIRNLADIASKGGNFLLNVGPMANGKFPQPSVERLQAIGSWLQQNGAAVYGTQASPFKNLPDARCTQKTIPGGTRLFLTAFNRTTDGNLAITGLGNTIVKVYALADNRPLTVTRKKANQVIDLNALPASDYPPVIALEIKGKPVIYEAPAILADASVFTDQLPVKFTSNIPGVAIRYTINGTDPIATSLPARLFTVKKNTTVKAASFLNGKQVSGIATAQFEKVTPIPAQNVEPPGGGLEFASYEGKWTQLPDFDKLSPAATGTVGNIDISMKRGKDEYAFVFEGWIRIPVDGVYTFYIASDDGSRLLINGNLLIDNDGLHSLFEKSKDLPLGKGYHAIKVLFFDNSGGDQLEVNWKGPGIPKSRIPDWVLFRK